MRSGMIEVNEKIDALYRMPLKEFTAARNALASELNKSGKKEVADKVKSLGKPSVSAWAVNQLYWKQRSAFNDLMNAGRNLIRAQVSLLSGGNEDVSRVQSEQRRAISIMLDMADQLLRDAGLGSSQEMLRRIARTLEALSAYPPGAGAPAAGRLTADVDPPGFESLVALISAAPAKPSQGPGKVIPFAPARKSNAGRKTDQSVAEAKAELRNAEQRLRDCASKARQLIASRDRAAAAAKDAEGKRRSAEEQYRKAAEAARESVDRFQALSREVEQAEKDLDVARRSVEEARGKIED